MNEQNVRDFFELFSSCPVCRKEIEKFYIVDFLLRKDLDSITLRKKLIRLIEKVKQSGLKLKIGIPCCICARKIFPNKKIKRNYDITAQHYKYLSREDVEQMLAFLFG